MSKRAGFLDGVALLIFLAPLRCRKCRLRFYRPWFVVKRTLPVITFARPMREATDIATDEVTTAEVAAPPTPAPAAAERGKVLLLDDDPAMRRLLNRLLSRDRYQVREASDAGSALIELRATRMDLIIVNLYDSDQEEKLVRALRSAFPELSVVVLSERLGPSEASEKVLILPKPSPLFTVMEGVLALMSPDRQSGNCAHAGT